MYWNLFSCVLELKKKKLTRKKSVLEATEISECNRSRKQTLSNAATLRKIKNNDRKLITIQAELTQSQISNNDDNAFSTLLPTTKQLHLNNDFIPLFNRDLYRGCICVFQEENF